MIPRRSSHVVGAVRSPRSPATARRRATAGLVIVMLAVSACASTDEAGATDTDSASTGATAVDEAGASSSSQGTTTDNDAADSDTSGASAQDSVDAPAVFDAGVVHAITVEFDQDDYDAMITAYQQSGDKGWIEATVTIDGVTYQRVGLRLKGNSSLRGLGADGGGFPRDGRGGDAADATTSPETLPWLIRLNKFVDGQDHQGYEDFVIRSNNSATSLNEAVALELLAAAGLASQRPAATSFSVNGSDAVLRLMVEHPDDDIWYEQAFDGAAGALYKAESTGDWSYRGDDPDSYDEVFDQEGGSDVADLSPLIEFLRFLDETDDAAFAAELPERLDVDAFATYLAMMDLVDNSDDIDGPGNNAYVWWDAATERLTIVPWDLNLAFSAGGAMGGPRGDGDGGGMPGDGRGGAPNPPTGMPADPPADWPGGRPGDGTGGVGGGMGTPPAGGGFGGMGGRANPLVERFLANDDFNARYQAALSRLRAELFTSGTAGEILDRWTALLADQATDLVDAATITSESDAVRAHLGD